MELVQELDNTVGLSARGWHLNHMWGCHCVGVSRTIVILFTNPGSLFPFYNLEALHFFALLSHPV